MNPVATFLGQAITAVLVVAAVIVGLAASFEAGAITYVVEAYSVGVFFGFTTITMRPSPRLPFCQSLSRTELETYRSYFAAIAFPGAAQAYSVVLDGLRLIGLIWAVVAFFKGNVWLGALLVAYWVIVGALAVKLNPRLYMSRAGPREQGVAIEQLHLLDSVQRKREEFYSKT
jgi:hypothetical protein